MPATDIPSAFQPGWKRARLSNPQLADRYVAYTRVGDPLADAVIEACQCASAAQQAMWFRAAIEDGPDAAPEAPQALRDLIAQAYQPPAWFDAQKATLGCRGFLGHSELFIAAFVGAVLIEGFSTLISQSFSLTGKLVDQGVHRLKQNNRHLAEIFMPGSLAPGGDGWRLSVRIRLMHARIRSLLASSPEWDAAAWGTPLCASHMAYATAAFSGGLLAHGRKLGARLTPEEDEAFMMIWRYSGHLMGVPEALQVATETKAHEWIRIGRACEPEPDLASIQLSNLLVNSAPLVAGITEPTEQRKVSKTIYRASRALVGDKLADQLQYPRYNTWGTLGGFRLRTRLDLFARRWVPSWEQRRRLQQFELMLGLSTDGRINYRLPARLHAEAEQTQHPS